MKASREARIDRISGVCWIIFGLMIAVHSSQMEIAEHLGGTFLTGPGFVPMLLGGALCILGSVLIVRTINGRGIAYFAVAGTVSDRRALAALVLMLIYAVGLVGRMPFGMAAFGFIFVFILAFNWPPAGMKAAFRLIFGALATAAATAVAVVYLFRDIFFIRLP
jgi:putative tricarboxylic transport membrane protein